MARPCVDWNPWFSLAGVTFIINCGVFAKKQGDPGGLFWTAASQFTIRLGSQGHQHSPWKFSPAAFFTIQVMLH